MTRHRHHTLHVARLPGGIAVGAETVATGEGGGGGEVGEEEDTCALGRRAVSGVGFGGGPERRNKEVGAKGMGKEGKRGGGEAKSTYASPEFAKPRVPAASLVAEPEIRHPDHHSGNPPRPLLPISVQERDDLLARISHADDIELHVFPRIGVYEGHHGGDMLLYTTMPLDAVLDGVDVHDAVGPVFLRERVPGLLRDGAGAAAVPDQLPAVCDDNTGVGVFTVLIRIGGVSGGGVHGVGEVEAGPCGEGDLPDGAVGEDAEVLDGLAEVEDQAGGGAEVRGGEDGDVGRWWG